MTPWPVAEAERLLVEARRIEAENHWRTSADKILMHSQLAKGLADLLEFRRGEIEVYQQLENLAGDMLEAIAVKPLNGSKRWWEEMPGPHSRFVSAIRRLRDWFAAED